VSADLRLVAGAAALALWLVLALSGHLAGGAAHLLALAGILLLPWRAGRARRDPEDSR
jgi:Flp pilus assembly protein TadB